MPINTKKILANAFLCSMEKKSVDKITVKELINECGISRPAFYYHFHDIVDLVRWVSDRIVVELIEQSLKKDDIIKGLECFINQAVTHRSSIKKSLASMHYEQFNRIYIEIIRNYLIKLLNNKYPDISLTAYDKDVTLLFIAHGISGVLLSYDTNKSFDAHKLAEQIFQMISSQIKLPTTV